VAEHHGVRTLGKLGIGANGLAAELSSQRPRLAGVDIGDQRGLSNTARKRRRHVPRPNETEPHRGESLLGVRF
jgi:hypothetical protein